MAEEELLSGGNTTVVVRVGETVRRPVGPWTPAVHDLLNHLTAAGFAGSPRVLGIDDADREILEFVPGEVGSLTASCSLCRRGFARRRAAGRSDGGSATSSSPRRGWWSTRPSRGDVRSGR